MSVNRNNPDKWKQDVIDSVDYYNKWFVEFAPSVFKENRLKSSNKVKIVFDLTDNLKKVNPTVLKQSPGILPVLRMTTCPPIARDRLIGLSQVPVNLVSRMEDQNEPSIPPRMSDKEVTDNLEKICETYRKLIDYDLFPWIKPNRTPDDVELDRSSLIIADRLCGAISDPILRNAQEQRQLTKIQKWLEERGYQFVESGEMDLDNPRPGTFTFRHNVRVSVGDDPGHEKEVNIPVDACIIRKTFVQGDLPILVEAKSAGDFTNVNKRRKEEAQKMNSLKKKYGPNVEFILFLSGYFDSGYLGYEAAEGIDWIWEHRIDDFEKVGL